MKRMRLRLADTVTLVVVISVVTATMVPAVQLACQFEQDMLCKRNLQVLALSWNLYAHDNDGKLVGGEPRRASDPRNEIEGPSWVVTPESLNAPLEAKKEHLKLGALWPYVQDVNAYSCPADLRAMNEEAWRSYSIPQGLNAGFGRAWEIETSCDTLDSVPSPSEKMAFLPESDPRGTNLGGWVMQPVTGNWADPIAMWHTGVSSNIAYADGHVAERYWESQGFVDWCTSSMNEPSHFSFGRVPLAGGEPELQDWLFVLNAYPYVSLTGEPRTYGLD